MNQPYDHIRQLYLEKLTGTISDDDALYLRVLLEENSEARDIWNELERENENLDADSVLARIDPENALNKWKKRPGKRVRRPYFLAPPRWIAAAAFIVALSLAYYYWQHSLLFPNPAFSTYAYKTGEPLPANSVALTTGNGKTVLIDKNQPGEFTIGNVRIKNSGKDLVYQGGPDSPEQLNTLFVPVKENYAVVLSDGSRVFLNSDSELRFPFYFNGDKREVLLKGEAYFEVEQDTGKPFIVRTELQDIRVTGTRFNVNTYDKGRVRTSLVEGSVSVTANAFGPVLLTPGMEAAYEDTNGFSTRPFEAGEVLSWRDGVHYFNQARLDELSGVISRWFGVKVAFKPGNLEQYRVSGLLEKGHLNEFLEDLRATSNITYDLNDQLLTLSRK
ncbi:DUF4974 domain-containing protein [Ravibacter arvi]|uniref:DUF4974 domain-containing protein n=1 Tax=Ravibacter arvi TaxID=2051041 RepID=A0ABP8LXG2_9BACT